MTGFDEFGISTTSSTSYAELRASGVPRKAIADALRSGSLIHARRDVYLSATAPMEIQEAQRVGGRIDCVSMLRLRGVFTRADGAVHVQVEPNRARLRSPRSRRKRLGPAESVRVHWRVGEGEERSLATSVVEALAQAIRCQPPRYAIATLDSALHLGLLTLTDLDEVFDRLPRRFHKLRGLVDGRAESGPETLARLIARAYGRVEVQLVFEGIGRADIVVNGWLVIECDSRAYHSGWEEQERDRIRDLKHAAQGRVSIRPTAHVLHTQPELVAAAVRGLLERFDGGWCEPGRG